jgi:threonine dehydrogenase-like Zn-dependent dehydrogenase
VRLIGADVCAVVRHEAPARLLAGWGIPAFTRDELPLNRAQVVIDCTGTAEGFADALALVEPRGTIILKSTYRARPQIDLTQIAVAEINVVGSRCGPFDAALRLLEAGLVDVESLIEAHYPLEDALEAFGRAAQHGVLKVLLDIS